jgi:GPH family glycoside/pentoside/hexuronide:cation symporter
MGREAGVARGRLVIEFIMSLSPFLIAMGTWHTDAWQGCSDEGLDVKWKIRSWSILDKLLPFKGFYDQIYRISAFLHLLACVPVAVTAAAPRATAGVPQTVLPRLSVARKVGFTIGDYGFNLYWQSVSLFLMFYYTDVIGLSATTAGLIYMVASIFDGITDPLMGAVADRTRSRWGRYRPYLLLGCVPLALSFGGLYYPPAMDGLGLTAVVMAAHLVFRVCYTALSIPYISLTARITQSSSERSSVAGFRMLFATLAGMTVSYCTQPLVGLLGGGDEARGFFYTACVFAIVATATFPIVFASVREPALSSDGAAPLEVLDYWRVVRSNSAFWLLMLAITFGALSSTVLGKSVLYYFKYHLLEQEAARYALSIKAAAGIVIIPAWVYVTRFLGKRGAWMGAAAWGLCGLAFFAVVEIDSAAPMIAFYTYMQVASLGVALTYWSMLPDTVEYGEWRCGVRAESFTFGFGIFFQKVALGLAAGLYGAALDLVGYVPNVDQTPETLVGMKWLIIVLCGAGLSIGALATFANPLKRGVHDGIVEQLEGGVPPAGAGRTPQP